jgi:hypothetical protein
VHLGRSDRRDGGDDRPDHDQAVCRRLVLLCVSSLGYAVDSFRALVGLVLAVPLWAVRRMANKAGDLPD